MGEVLQLPRTTPDKAERDRRRGLRQSLRLRIDRHARQLAVRDQERYFRAMVSDLMHGRLQEELVEFWSPMSGDVGAPQRKES